MRRPSSFRPAVLAWGLSNCIGAGVIGANQAMPVDPLRLSVEPVVQEHVSVEVTGGTITAGHFGGQMEACGVGTQAFVKKTGDWQRCQQSPLGGTCADEGGEPLFAGFGCYDPSHIKASTVYDVFEETTGNLLVTGEVHLAWDSGPDADVVTARGAFILRLGPDGTPLDSACIGPQPDGPPSGESCCGTLCDLPGGGGGGGGSCGGRAVAAVDADQVVATGWCDSPPGVLPENKNYFVVSLSGDLSQQQWMELGSCRLDDAGQAIAVDMDDNIFFTGYGGDRHDIIVGKYLPDGTRVAYEEGGGPLLDEGRSIRFDEDGRVIVGGIVNEMAQFGGADLGAVGDGQQGFDMTLDDGLQVLAVEMNPQQQVATLPVGPGRIDGSERLRDRGETSGVPLKMVQRPHQIPPPPPPPPQPPPPQSPPPEGGFLHIDKVEVDVGHIKGGSVEDLLTSDNEYLVFTEGEDPENPGSLLIRFLIYLQPAAEHFQVSSLGMEIKAESCYTGTVEVQGLLGEEFFLIGRRDVCPADEPMLVAEISSDLSAELGLDLVAPVPDPEQRVVVRMTIDYHHTLDCECPDNCGCDCNCLCSGLAEDGSVDDFDVDY